MELILWVGWAIICMLIINNLRNHIAKIESEYKKLEADFVKELDSRLNYIKQLRVENALLKQNYKALLGKYNDVLRDSIRGKL